MKKTIFFLLNFLFFSNFLSAQTDYSNVTNWAALPDSMDNADWVPEKCSTPDGQANAKADVFFIHPTTYLMAFKGNAALSNRTVNGATDDGPIKFQASVFNASCKVYAPRYQQAALHNFFTKDTKESQDAFDVAYADVKAAFEYYLKNYNNGRPIVIAGHSQGTYMAKRLLAEFFDGKPLKNQLVAAYLVGYPVEGNYFQELEPCRDSAQINCFVTYNTFGWNATPEYADYDKALCTNPLSWKTDELFVSSKSHLGGINKKMDGVVPNLTGCKCNNGVLWVQKPEEAGFIPIAKNNYHLYDYQLFYMNIRQNVSDRIDQYLTTHK